MATTRIRSTSKAPAKGRTATKRAPAKKRSASQQRLEEFREAQRARARELLPIPVEALDELRRRLAKLTPKVSLDGWDECPPLFVSPSPGTFVRGAWFDVDAVVKVVKARCSMRHTKGRWAGRPLVPDAWQVVWTLAPVFGWKYSLTHRDPELAGTRIVREMYEEVPRKNGKSTDAASLALILLTADGELGAEVYSAATSRDQAKIVGDDVKKMAAGTPALKGKLDLLANLIRVKSTGGIFRPLSKLSEAAHGLNVSGAVIDELHVHKTRDLVDAIETGTGARAQPLIIVITTADEGKSGTIYEEKHERARKSHHRIIKDPALYAVVWAAADTDDPFDELTWRKANPGFGRSCSRAYLASKAEKARTTKSFYPTFCRLHLNRRMRQQTRWLNLTDWDKPANTKPVTAKALFARDCWGGLDLSATTDLTAFSLVFPTDDHETLRSLNWFWLPEEGLAERIERDQVPYDQWAEDGWLTLTEGNVVDYDKVVETIHYARRRFNLRGLGHDRWQAGPVVQALTKLGIDATPVPQTYQGMSAASKVLEMKVVDGRFVHGGNPVLRWMADAVEILKDKADNIRPVKPDRQTSIHRVDGIHSNVMAIDAWMRRPESTAPAAAPSLPDGGGEDIFKPSRLSL